MKEDIAGIPAVPGSAGQPPEKRKADLVVIGAGSGGLSAAAGAAMLGLDVVKNFFPALLALGVVALLPVAYKKIAGRKAARLEEAAQ